MDDRALIRANVHYTSSNIKIMYRPTKTAPNRKKSNSQNCDVFYIH